MWRLATIKPKGTSDSKWKHIGTQVLHTLTYTTSSFSSKTFRTDSRKLPCFVIGWIGKIWVEVEEGTDLNVGNLSFELKGKELSKQSDNFSIWNNLQVIKTRIYERNSVEKNIRKKPSRV